MLLKKKDAWVYYGRQISSDGSVREDSDEENSGEENSNEEN